MNLMTMEHNMYNISKFIPISIEGVHPIPHPPPLPQGQPVLPYYLYQPYPPPHLSSYLLHPGPYPPNPGLHPSQPVPYHDNRKMNTGKIIWYFYDRLTSSPDFQYL